uniref:Ig-like domain-containing protein n=1 Tax=Felis catus TaxID=9685 RepID=A0ABI7X2R4_FELCA
MWLLSRLVLVASLCSYTSGGIFITQFVPSITKKKGNTAFLECQVKTGVLKKNVNIHWYRQRPDQPLKRILYISSNENVVHEQGISEEKYEARKRQRDLPASLRIHKISEEDAGLYYCACWESGWIKIFAEGTKLIVTPPDKSPDEDTSPKPTIFLPSPAERTLHKTGTYLCLLEDFFPDVIKVDWKEKNGKTILKSQQGNTMKTKDTYMKYTWLTVTEKSMDKEHTCIVKHEKNKGGGDQEILFPSINTELPAINSTEALLKDENDPLQLQLVTSSAYYTYVILLVKSVVYTIIIAYRLLGRPALCRNEKSS